MDRIIGEMTDTITYRGPDDSGFWMDLERGIAFGQRRLSILDLSLAGHQPMESDDGNVVVTYNGEIYNFKAIRKQLEGKGYSFHSDCDTEVIIKGYEEYGIEIVDQFNGMFAFGLYDKVKETLYLVRDRLGVKPLFFYYDHESNFAFASELKPIMKAPFFRKEIDFDSLNMYLANQYIAGPKSIFNNTYKLPPGQILMFHKGQVELKSYWSLTEKFNKRKAADLSFEETCNSLDQLLNDAVRVRMMADVPVGCFLSGGIDSSLISSIAQANHTSPIDTFTIGFTEEEYNEAPYARKIAETIGSSHHEEYCSVNDMKGLVGEIPKYFDEPFADSSMIPSMLVSRIARKNVTVALSGDAGDELFCGYNVYDQMLLYRKLYWMGKLLKKFGGIKNKGDQRTWRLSKVLGCSSDDDAVIIDYIKSNDFIQKISKVPPSIAPSYRAVKELNTNHIQEKRMILDCVTYLPDDILQKVDRSTMHCSLEGRSPLLDYRVVEYSFQIPLKYKYFNGEKKYILKKILERYIPREQFERPKKGFSVPIGQWLQGELHYLIDQYLNEDYIKMQGVFDCRGVKELLNQYETYHSKILTNIVWSLLVFQLWYEEYMN